MKNKKTILLIIGILLSIIFLAGISYAYYIKSINQEESNVVKTKCLNFSLTNEKNDIKLDEQYPIPDSEGRKLTPYQFTITNTCEQFISYNVNLEFLETTTMDSSAVKVMINNEAPVNLSTLESTSVSINTSKDSKILATGSLGSNDSVEYALRLWMDYGDSADTSSMNKVFESKIVVTATVGTYKPSDYVTTLHDAILVNEYGVKNLDNAISKIEAKGTPNFNNSAPIVEWQEKKTNNLVSLETIIPHESIVGNETFGGKHLTSENIKIMLATGYSFDKTSGTYSLTNIASYSKEELKKLDFNNDYYYCRFYSYSDSSGNKYTVNDKNCKILYKINRLSFNNYGTPNTSNYSTYYAIKAYEYNYEYLESDKSDKGLYTAEDDYGVSFYYRGNVVNNYVEFAGYKWQIVRINGDNSIRIMYAGKVENSSNNTYIDGKFNNSIYGPEYIGYKYGNTEGTTGTRENNISNGVNSVAATILNDFYNDNIVSKSLEKYISNTGFCGDRSLASGDGFSKDKYTLFSSTRRLTGTNINPTLKCPDKEHDLYTTSTADIGNKALDYPIGLITADELSMSGYRNDNINILMWSSNGQKYFTMTPYQYVDSSSSANVWYAGDNGTFSAHWVTSNLKLLPVINLKSNVEISGGIGTVNDPYIVKTN